MEVLINVIKKYILNVPTTLLKYPKHFIFKNQLEYDLQIKITFMSCLEPHQRYKNKKEILSY